MLSTLKECGIAFGTFSPGIESEEISNKMIILNPEIAWIAVNTEGSCASVLIRERIIPPEIRDDAETADLAARRSGYVTETEVFSGRQVVFEGSTFEKGQILVEAVADNSESDKKTVGAKGQIFAKTWYKLTGSIPISFLKKTIRGRKKRSIRFKLDQR